MMCNACVIQINTINHISEIGIHTNELMYKLLEKQDTVRKLYNCIINNGFVTEIVTENSQIVYF